MNRLFSYFLHALSVVILVLLSFSCANIGTITGGDKDSIPPEMIASKPVYLDTGFTDDKIIIQFNEYFELKDINQEFVASPPFEEVPDFKIKKKFLVIKFNEPLQDSVTYTLNFGNAIADYNEGNIAENYRFVFSTKSEIDSFSISGNLKNAFNQKVPESAHVMIFENHEDSIPFKSLPNYMCKIDTSGNFSIDFIKPGAYKIFALSDINTNMRADVFEDRAFLDSLIIPELEPFTKIDSIKAGTVLHDINDSEVSDSLVNDTVIITNTYKSKPSNLQLYMFAEESFKQRVLDYSRKERGKVTITFELPVKPDFLIKPLNFQIAPENVVLEKNFTNDTITWWINDTTVLAIDSLQVGVSFMSQDSLGEPILINDTLLFEFRKKKDTNAWKKKNTDENTVVKKDYLKLNYLAKDDKVELDKKLKIESPTPLLLVDTSKIRLFEIMDTSTTDTKQQMIVKAFRLKKNLLSFRFKRPIIEDFSLSPLNFTSENWYTSHSSDSNRVYVCQITDTAVSTMDTIKLMVEYDNRFFFDQVQLLRDTAIMPITPQKILSRKRNEAEKIVLVFDKPLRSDLEVIPGEFTTSDNWYNVQKNTAADTVTINLSEKTVSNKDTLTFSVRCFDYFDLNNDSVFFNETMRLTYSEKKQFLVSGSRMKREVIVFVFNKSMNQNPEIQTPDFTLNTQWYELNKNNRGDTLTYTITDKFVSDIDSLNLILKYIDTDRKGIITNFADTVQLIPQKKNDYNTPTPASESASLEPKTETVHIYLPRTYELLTDSLYVRQRLVNSEWKEKTKYLFRLDSMAFVNIYNIYNQSEDYEFATRELDYYSTLSLNLANIMANQKEEEAKDSLPLDSMPVDSILINKISDSIPQAIIPRHEIDSVLGSGHIIVQLLGKEDVVVKEYFISEDQEIKMDFLHPGDYQLKIIFDRNNNGKWDTGNYFKHIQPERVIINGKVLQLKSKFENKLEWNVGKSLIKSFTK